MGKVNWPLQDIRKNPAGEWQLKSIPEEYLNVPTGPDTYGYYTSHLVEKPAKAGLDGSNPAPEIQCPIGTFLNVIETGTPDPSQVLLNYDNGSLSFHPSKKGYTGLANYYGKGSLIEAAEANDLNNRLSLFEGGSTSQAGDTGVKGPTGLVGATGMLGYPGYTGMSGAIGETGLKGGRGENGIRGYRGVTGSVSIGSTGFPGEKGRIGSTGLRNIRGNTGPMGLVGITGLGGPPGVGSENKARYISEIISGQIWTVNHQLGEYPIIEVFDISGSRLEPQEISNGVVSSYITFNAPETGFAVCVLGGVKGSIGTTGLGPKGATGITVNFSKFEASFPTTAIWGVEHHHGKPPITQVFSSDSEKLSPTGIKNGPDSTSVFLPTAESGYVVSIAGGSEGYTGAPGPGLKTLAVTSTLIGATGLLRSGQEKDLRLSWEGQIKKITLLAGSTGDVQLDLRKSNFETYPPDSSDSITGGNPLTLSGEIKKEIVDFTGWETGLKLGDILRLHVDSSIGINQLTVLLEMAPGAIIGSSSSSSTSSSSTSFSSSSTSSSSQSRSSSSSSLSRSSSSSSTSFSSSSSSSSSSSFSFSSSSSSSTADISWTERLKAYDKDLISVWQCEDDIASTKKLTDDIDSNDGTAHGGVSTLTEGKYYKGIQFDGSNGYIEVQHKLDLLQNSGTLSFWFNRSEENLEEFLFDKSLHNGGPFSISLNSSNEIVFDLRYDGSHFEEMSISGVQKNNWHHVVAIWGKPPSSSRSHDWEGLVVNYNAHLVSIYTMDESSPPLIDDYGANNGTEIGSPIYGAQARSGRGIEFTGTNAFRIPSDVSLRVNKFTISSWVYINSFEDKAQIFGSVHENSSHSLDRGYGLTIQGTDKIGVLVKTTGGSCIPGFCASDLSSKTWHHVVGTYDGSSVKLYIDGTQRASYDITGNIVFSSDDFQIGRSVLDSSTNYFIGIIDEVYLWDQALPSQVVMDLWNGGWGRFYAGSSASALDPLDSISFFLDLNPSAGVNYSEPYDDQLDPIVIGRKGSISDKYYTGGMDSIYYWDKALPYSAVIDLYNSGYGSYYSSSSSSFSNSSSSTNPYPIEEGFDPILMAYDSALKHVWRLNEVSGPSVEDQRGNDDGLGEGDLVYGVRGVVSPALGFPGSNGLVRVFESPGLMLTGDLTVSFWIRFFCLDQGSYLKGLLDKANGNPRWEGGFYIALDNREETGADNAIVVGVGQKIQKSSDKFDEYDLLLIHFDGEVDSSKFEDLSRYQRGLIGNDAKIKNDGVFGECVYFDGSAFVSAETLELSNEDYSLGFVWTLDFWVKYTPVSGKAKIVSTRGADNNGWEIGVNYNQNFYFQAFGGFQATGELQTSGYIIRPDTWYHLAIINDGSKFRIFINGTMYHESVYAVDLGSSNKLFIGKSQNFEDGFTGYIDEFRLSKGVARWEQAFTPPEHEYRSGRFNSDALNFYSRELGALYSLDNNHDACGGRDLDNSGVSFDAPGVVGSAATFSGAQSLTAPMSTIFYPKNSLTLSCWVKADDWRRDQQVVGNSTWEWVNINGSWGYAWSHGYSIRINGRSSAVAATLRRSNAYVELHFDAGSNLDSDTWHHFVLTYDGRYTKLYVDGDLKDSDDAGVYGDEIIYAQNPLQIGATSDSDYSPEAPYFVGELDSCALWSTALGPREISELYNNGKGRRYSGDVYYESSDFNYAIARAQNAIEGTDWHHVAIIWGEKSQVFKFYINGELIENEILEWAGNVSLGPNELDLTFGHFPKDENWPQLFFKGVLDEIYIWNDVLSRKAVTSLYNSGSGRWFSSSSSSSSSNSSSSISLSSSSESFSSSHSSSSSMTPDRSWTPLEPYDGNLYAWALEEASGTRSALMGGYDLEDYNGTDQTNGKRGYAALFTGSERLEIPVTFLGYNPLPEYDGEAPVVIKSDFTLSFWLRAEQKPSTTDLFLSKYDELYGYQFKFYVTESGNIYFEKESGSYASPEYALPLGRFVHIMLAGNGSSNNIDFYIDGSKKTTVSWHDGDSENAGLFLGGPPYGTDGWFEGRIDEFYYWDVRIPDNKLQDIYNFGYGKFYPISSSSSSSSFSSSSCSSMSRSSSSESHSSSSLSSSSSSSSLSSSSVSFSSSSISSSSTANTEWPSGFYNGWDKYLIAAYNFDDGLACHDVRGGHNGLISGQASVIDGKLGKAIRFYRSQNSWMDIPDLDLSKYDTGALSMWLRFRDLDVWSNVLWFRADEDGRAWRVAYDGANSRFYIGNRDISYSVTSTDWLHLFIDKNDWYITVRVNGSQIGSLSSVEWWSSYAGGSTGRFISLRIGEGSDIDLDSLYLWSDYRVRDEMREITYNQGYGKFYSDRSPLLLDNTKYHIVVYPEADPPSESYVGVQVEDDPNNNYYSKSSAAWAKEKGRLPLRVWIGDNYCGIEPTQEPDRTELLGVTDSGSHCLASTFETGDYSGKITSVDLFSTSVTFKPGVNITDGLMALFEFNDAEGSVASDSSGNSNHGTLHNFPSKPWRRGRIGGGGALYFDTSNRYVEVLGDFLGWAPASFTICFWTYPSGRDNYDHIISAKNGWGSFRFQTDGNGGIYCGIDTGSDRFDGSHLGSDTLELNKWQHFAFTFNNGYARFYKNGELISVADGWKSPAPWTGLWIGWNNGDTINGLLEELRVYNRALSADEISVLGNPNALALRLDIREGHEIGKGRLVATSLRDWSQGWSGKDWLPSAGWFSFVRFEEPSTQWTDNLAAFDDDLIAAWNLDESQGTLKDGARGNDGILDGNPGYGATGINQ